MSFDVLQLMMRCPTCDNELREAQVETMVGNPEFNEWCRNGYCSQKCYEIRDPKASPVPPRPRSTQKPRSQAAKTDAKDWNAADPIAYSLATYSLLAVPFYLGLSLLGRFFGVHRSPEVAPLYFGILFVVLMVTGLCAGLFALISIRKHGAERILWKSLIGVLLIGGFSYIGVSDLLKP